MTNYEMWSVVLGIAGVIISATAFWQIRLLITQNQKEHEEKRRLHTVELMLEWSKSLKRETSFAETVVEGLNHEQSKCLFEKKTFKVDKKTMQMILEVCPEWKEEYDFDLHRDSYEVKDMVLAQLRWYVISYLNMLETIMTAWNIGILDKETIVQQYSYLYSEEKGWNVLSAFRMAAGKNAYPNIDAFIEELKRKGGGESVSRKRIL